MGILGYYLIIINVVGFVLLAVNSRVRSRAAEKLIMLAALLGGSFGVLVSVFIFDRKANKDNMLLRVFTVCVLVIQIVISLILQGFHGEKINLAFWEFFVEHKIFSGYLAAINAATFAAFGLDKMAAVGKRSRIKIVTLLGLCFVGGSLGGICAMHLFHHKTNKNRNNFFTVGVPLMLVMQIVVIFYLMNI
ncbi:MAG: DUF1294 domain-containing protein [Clostridia bacterium]|nr:DUF1294 domain-containing protein [Clostridia bacterium]